MSILIRGAEAPRICGVCPFERNGWPDEWEEHCMLLGRQVGYFGKKERKPEDCPIIEVATPHGRLIDADNLVSVIDDEFTEQTRTSSNPIEVLNKAVLCGFAKDVITAAPTIIEAEEGADNE